MQDDFNMFSPAIQKSKIIRDNTLVRNFTAKETIFIEKDLCDEVYFILAGEVKVTSFHTNGKEVWHATLTKGYTFGEMAAISGRSRSATVETLKPSKIGIIEKSHFLSALESEAGLALYFLKDMVARLQKTTEYSNERAALDIQGRICAELLRQAQDAPLTNNESDVYAVHSDLTVTALAQRINANRETVSRTISTLTESGCLKKQGRQFFITDMKELMRRAES
jgi:CRP-like cAMP-binding protein